MAELNVVNPSLVDILSRTDPDNNIGSIIEAAEKSNPIIADAIYQECNDGSKHQNTIRVGIPEPAFRMYNQGVQPSKTETAQVVDTTGMIEDYCEVDKALADMSGNANAFRATEVVGKLQGFNNFVASNMFYGDTGTNPQGFMGLDARFNDLGAASGRQITDAGGTGSDNTSVWMVTWGQRGAQLLYPKGSAVGFSHRNLGEDTKRFSDGKLMQIYLDHMKWDLGFTLGDWRCVSRVANIDVSNLTKDAATGADLLDLMIDAEENLDTTALGVDVNGQLVSGKTVIYVSRTVAKFLRKQALNKSNVQLSVEEVAGKRTTMWGEFPVHRIDSLLDTEARIV